MLPPESKRVAVTEATRPGRSAQERVRTNLVVAEEIGAVIGQNLEGMGCIDGTLGHRVVIEGIC